MSVDGIHTETTVAVIWGLAQTLLGITLVPAMRGTLAMALFA